MPGPPLSNDTALVTLIKHSVTVALGVREAWEARNTRFELQWVRDSELLSFSQVLAYEVYQAILESNGRIDRDQAYALVSTNLEKLLGIRATDNEELDMVAYEGGGVFDLTSKVVAVISPEQRGVNFF